MAEEKIQVNRAPVLALWASVVAERLGYSRAEALNLGQAVAGLNAQSKGRRLGIYRESEEGERKPAAGPGEDIQRVPLLGREVTARKTPHGLRALVGERVESSERVDAYLAGKFGERLADVRRAMEELAASRSPHELEEEAYSLYERFRPVVPSGKRGWGAAGELDLELIRSLARGRE